MQLEVYTVLALALLRQTSALQDGRPTQTAFVDLINDPSGFSPNPTQVPAKRTQHFLDRRQAASSPGPTCGFISANFENPITCDIDQYCAINTALGVLGCCESYSRLSGGGYTYSSCLFQTTCYDYTASDDCTGTCADNTRNGYCPSSEYPYCQTFSLTESGISAFACWTVEGLVVSARKEATTTYATFGGDEATDIPPVGPDTSASDGPAPTDTTTDNSSTTGGGGSRRSSVVGPAVGGAIGGLAVILIAAGGFWWLRMKHNKNKQAAATTTTTTTAAANNNNAGTGPPGGVGSPGPGSGPGLAAGGAAGGAAVGAYAANEYFKPQQQQEHTEPGPPVYPGPQMTQTHPPNQTLHPPSMSEMPSSPTMTAQTHSSVYGSQQPISEIDGTNSTATHSPIIGGASHAQRKSIGTSSLLSGSAGGTDVDNISSSGQIPQSPTQSSTTGAVPSAGASTQPTSQGGMGYQAGPVGDWNRPYHELE